MTDTSIRDRLADIMADEDPAHPSGRPPFAWHHIALNRLFAELQEPSEGMIDAGQRSSGTARENWRAIVQHIREGGS